MKAVHTVLITIAAVCFLSAGSMAASAAINRLPDNATWHIQLDGKLKLPDKQVYDLDLFDTPQETINLLHAQGKRVICYFSAGTYEDWRADKANFSPAIIGKGVKGWKGENWLNIANPAVLTALRSRLDIAAQKTCEGVDADNMDVGTQDSGFTISKVEQAAFANALSAEAHQRGMLIGLKNATEMIPAVANNFDFAVNESCLKYNECAAYLPFVQAHKNVFAIEYTGYSKSKCAKAKTYGLNIQFYKKSLKDVGKSCPVE